METEVEEASVTSEGWVRARRPRIWGLRFAILWVVAFFLFMSAADGLDVAEAAVAIVLAFACELWTLRMGVRAHVDGLAIIGVFLTKRIPAADIGSLQVVRTKFAWFKVVDLQVGMAYGDVVIAPWVSWGTQLEQLMTVTPPALPRPSQQRVLDELAVGLGLARASSASDAPG